MENIKLYESYVHENSENVTMDCYIKKPCMDDDHTPTPAVVVFPGGGYIECSRREAEPIAHMFLSRGYSVFVVWYTVAPHCHKINPLLDAAMAIHTVRKRCAEFNVDPHKIAVCGFSAGGHLAGLISTMHHSDIIKEKLSLDGDNVRPDASILCYPVISGVNRPNETTFRKLLGKDEPSYDELLSVSVETLVDDNTPPAFVWHTAEDQLVDTCHPMSYCAALSEHNIPFELHIFPKGVHGLSLADRHTCRHWRSRYVAKWIDLCADWCENIFYDGNFLN